MRLIFDFPPGWQIGLPLAALVLALAVSFSFNLALWIALRPRL